jgi:hypothetical protein
MTVNNRKMCDFTFFRFCNPNLTTNKSNTLFGEISGFHGGNMKMTVFWDVAPCSLVEIYRRFRGACPLHHQRDESSVDFYQTTRRNITEDSHQFTVFSFRACVI